MSSYKLISVESRKGGVGKTTAALNLGSLLKEKYHILLLDMDITGTSISAIRYSHFWDGDVLLLEKEDEPINLLQFFSKSYLRGEEVFDFSLSQKPGHVQVEKGRINVLASELYGDDSNLLYDPSILLDNLHVYWLTTMITSVCERFEACFDDGKQCVIILDNSPGFVGLGKAVHSIMTDLGPERSKFLMVSSLDIQDFESSLKSMSFLHQEYLNKLYGSQYPETQKGDERFYAQVQLSGATEYEYYKTQREETGIKSYQGLIINKVPKRIVEGWSHYNYKLFLKDLNLQSLFDDLYEERFNDYLVPFDSVLQSQFYGAFEERSDRGRANLTTLKRRINSIETQVKMLNELEPYNLLLDLLRRAEGFERTIDTLKGALIASGYEVIASKFNPEWSPVDPFRKMIAELKDAGYASNSFELYVPKRNRMATELKHFDKITLAIPLFAEEIKQDYVWIAVAVASVACELSFCLSSNNLWGSDSTHRNETQTIKDRKCWTDKLNEVLFIWMSRIIQNYSTYVDGKKNTLAAYVISDDAKKCDALLKELLDRDAFITSFKMAVSRMADISSDMQTLVNLIRAITVNNDGRFSLDVDFVPFLNHKIVEKRFDYESGKDIMPHELRDSDYMACFRDIIGRVVDNWGV